MVHHIVFWNLKEELSAEERGRAALEIKRRLEAAANQVSGVLSLEVVINEMDSSNKDIGLISAFKTAEDLNAYQIHPAHMEAAEYVRNVVCNRACLDYET